MGLFDSLAGNLDGFMQNAAGGHPALAGIMQLVQNQPGGLAGLTEKFQQGGMGEIVQSWVGFGTNLPVSSDQIQSVLGSGAIADFAGKLGISPDQASGQIAEFLPGLVDKLTPNGTIPNQNDLLSQGASLLQGFLGGK